MASSVIIYLLKYIKGKRLKARGPKLLLLVKVFIEGWATVHIYLKFAAIQKKVPGRRPFCNCAEIWGAQHVGLGHWTPVGASPFQSHPHTLCSSLCCFLVGCMFYVYKNDSSIHSGNSRNSSNVALMNTDLLYASLDKSNWWGLILTW